MSRLLHVISSPRGETSVSRRVTTEVVAAAGAAASFDIDDWDLWADPLPMFGPDEVAAKMTVIGGGTSTGEAGGAWARVRTAFERFDAADTYVFGVPMWNAGIPWVLKHPIDTITQPGLLFRFDPATGCHGLLRGKRAVVVYTSAVYRPGVAPAFGRDFHATYFEDWLAFAGITDVCAIRLPPTRPGSGGYPVREVAALAAARAVGAELARERAA